MNQFKKQLGFTLPIAILIVAVLIIAGGAGYYFYKTSQEQKEVNRKPEEPGKISEIKPLDETWNTYINHELGFSIKVPKEMMHYDGSCKWVEKEHSYRPKAAPVSVQVFEDIDNNIVYISSEYFYELAGKIEEVSGNRFTKCNKIINSLELLKKGSGGSNWEIVMRKVANDSELEQFIKERYGAGCGLGKKVPTEGAIKQEGVYSVGIDTGGARDIDEAMEIGCVVNYITVLKYFPARNRVISWDMGQAFTFSGLKDVVYDSEMFNSFRFLEMDETDNWNVYQNEEYGYEIKYPQDWKIVNVDWTVGREYVQFFSPLINNKYYFVLNFGARNKGDDTQISYQPNEDWELLKSLMRLGDKVEIGNVDVLTTEIVEKGKVHSILYSNRLGAGRVEISGLEIQANSGFIEGPQHLSASDVESIDLKNLPELKLANQILSTFEFIETKVLQEENEERGEIEIYPGALEIELPPNLAEEIRSDLSPDAKAMVYSSKDSIEKIKNWYESYFAKRGWKKIWEKIIEEHGFSLLWEKDGIGFLVNLIPSGEEKTTILLVTDKFGEFGAWGKIGQ